MRTGSFSHSEIISKLNTYFAPVYAVNEDYADNGTAPKEEKAELQRIQRETLSKKMSAGSVHVYITAPDGTIFGSLHVADAAQPAKLIALLNKAIATFKPVAGKPLVAPKPQSVAPSSVPDALTLHLTSRPLSGGGSWEGISENWVTYTPAEVAQLLPRTALSEGQTWTPNAKLVSRLLVHFYPVTENNDPAKNKIHQQTLSATVLRKNANVIYVRLDGTLKMAHWFYHKPDDKTVEATFCGYVEADLTHKRILRLHLATQNATYGGGTFGVAVHCVP
jgi:hypothetical protein